jgi:hypothetical protein
MSIVDHFNSVFFKSFNLIKIRPSIHSPVFNMQQDISKTGERMEGLIWIELSSSYLYILLQVLHFHIFILGVRGRLGIWNFPLIHFTVNVHDSNLGLIYLVGHAWWQFR